MTPQKTCIFRGFGAAVNHHSVAASYYYFLLSELVFIFGSLLAFSFHASQVIVYVRLPNLFY